MDILPNTKQLLRRALEGENLSLDSTSYTLHDMTQIAVALQPGSDLAIRNAFLMSPIERASVASAGRGRVLFF